MRKPLVTIIQLLDGTPADYGKRQAGQSVVELALITPILIVLLAGLVEIGWFANNYLNLLDVSRVGARRAAVLQDTKSPLFWQNIYSYVPNALLPTAYQMPNTTTAEADENGTDLQRFHYRWFPQNFALYPGGGDGRQACDTGYTDRVFYNEVICTMITSMDPLTINPTNGVDDIIVSGFSLQLVDPTGHPNWLPAQHPLPASMPQEIVAGRYPTNANECDVQNAGGTAVLAPRPGDGDRDPFDFYYRGSGHVGRDVRSPDVASTDPNLHETQNTSAEGITELFGYDAPATDVEHAEKQVGFSLFGNHRIDGTYCVGSDWTTSQVEDLMNLSGYDLSDASQLKYLPSQGLVLVEIYWQHEMLLKIPVLSPVFTVVGNSDGKMVINVWAAFPLTSVEPHVIFPS